MSSSVEPRVRSAGEPPPDLSAAATRVHHFVARRVRNRDDAADIAQQALLQACAKRDTCRGDNVRAWLFTIARHLIVDHYRARGRFRFLDVTDLAKTEPALRTEPDAVLAAFHHRRRLACWVDGISRRLRLEEQVAVLLADLHGHRDKDSSLAMGMSLPSFKLLLHRARSRLHAIADGRCAGGGRLGAATRSAAAPPSHAVVTRRLGESQLLALRSRLLQGFHR